MAAVAHAPPQELREKLDEWTGGNSGIWSVDADLDGIIGLLPAACRVHDRLSRWPVALRRGVARQAAWRGGASHCRSRVGALVDELNRYEVASALDGAVGADGQSAGGRPPHLRASP